MTRDILSHLKIKEKEPGLEYLQELMIAYCTHVPWESLSRIVKKSLCKKPEDCLRTENEFWSQSFTYGTGGTCYESNWAFYKLLKSLGFDAYLTVNKIADKSSVHAATVVTLNRSGYIVDIGYPLYAPIPILENQTGYVNHPIINYRSVFTGPNEYLVENFPHPKPYLYHLTDIPVSERDYLNIAIADYCETGLFLDRIVIRKIINNTPTRFDSEDLPYNIHQLHNGTKTRAPIREEYLINTLSDHFAIDMDVIRKAFEALNMGISASGSAR